MVIFTYIKECMDMRKDHPKRLGRQKPIINEKPPENYKEVINTDDLPGSSPENPVRIVEDEERGD